MKELEDSLKMNFGKIEPRDLTAIITLFKPEIIHKGKYFLKTGRFANKLSYIKSGFLRIFVESEKKEITQWISTKGYFVTDLASFINDVPARWCLFLGYLGLLYSSKKCSGQYLLFFSCLHLP